MILSLLAFWEVVAHFAFEKYYKLPMYFFQTIKDSLNPILTQVIEQWNREPNYIGQESHNKQKKAMKPF